MEILAENYIASGIRVIELEAQSLIQLSKQISKEFAQACEVLLHCQGRVIVIGMGKSGHIASKIAATMASTGTPSFFVHPGEANHGDLGMITHQDVVLALSYSGETGEILNLLPALKRFGVPLIGMTGNPQSSLAKNSDIHLNVQVEREACSLNLAPTSSTTAMLALGDALAITLLETRGFSKEDFAFSHPGGSLGRRLLLKVEDIMHHGDEVPRVFEHSTIKDALIEMTRTRLGATAIINEQNQVLGVFTDGDLRRSFENKIDLSTPIHQLMTPQGKTVTPQSLAAEALRIMESHRINALLVVDQDQSLVGALNMHDLLRSGIL